MCVRRLRRERGTKTGPRWTEERHRAQRKSSSAAGASTLAQTRETQRLLARRANQGEAGEARRVTGIFREHDEPLQEFLDRKLTAHSQPHAFADGHDCNGNTRMVEHAWSSMVCNMNAGRVPWGTPTGISGRVRRRHRRRRRPEGQCSTTRETSSPHTRSVVHGILAGRIVDALPPAYCHRQVPGHLKMGVM